MLEQLHSPCASGCHHAPPADVAGPSSEGADASGPNGPYSRATLVICPLVAVIQWRQEIARYVAPNALRVSKNICPSPPHPRTKNTVLSAFHTAAFIVGRHREGGGGELCRVLLLSL